MAHATYSPKDVVISWNGISITGFAEDSFLRLSWNSDIFIPKTGADGTLALTKSADQTGTIEIELMATASSNAVLGAIEKTQRATENGVAFSNFTFSDLSGNVLAVALNAYMLTRPEIDVGSDQNSKTWVFGCETMEFLDLPPAIASEVSGVLDGLSFTF